jgi:hypothetical protein
MRTFVAHWPGFPAAETDASASDEGQLKAGWPAESRLQP